MPEIRIKHLKLRMDYYVIDVQRHRIQKAMLSLGIESEELRKKTYQDFGGRDVKDEIQNLRYNFFQRKQQELVRQIKAFAKEDILKEFERNKQQKVKESHNTEFLVTTISLMDKDTIQSTSKYQTIVDRTYLEVAGAFTDKIALDTKLKHCEDLREKTRSEQSKRKIKLIELKERQQQNYLKLKVNQERYIRNYDRAYSARSSPRKKILKNTSYDYPTNSSRKNSVAEIEISSQIEDYEKRMNKSKLLYDLGIKSKIQAASKLLERSERLSRMLETNKEAEEQQRVLRLISKNLNAETRRYGFLKHQAETKAKMREKTELRTQKAQCKLKEREIINNKRAKAIEKKMEISSNLLEQKHSKWVRELELRKELQRLKDEESMLNAERKKRIL